MNGAYGKTMAKIKISPDRCKGCCLCVAECPKGLLRMSELLNDNGHQFAEITDPENCTGCALCCQICPDIAIEIEDVEAGSKDKKTKSKKGVKS